MKSQPQKINKIPYKPGTLVVLVQPSLTFKNRPFQEKFIGIVVDNHFPSLSKEFWNARIPHNWKKFKIPVVHHTDNINWMYLVYGPNNDVGTQYKIYFLWGDEITKITNG